MLAAAAAVVLPVWLAGVWDGNTAAVTGRGGRGVTASLPAPEVLRGPGEDCTRDGLKY